MDSDCSRNDHSSAVTIPEILSFADVSSLLSIVLLLSYVLLS